jgi:hypothetical protein
VKRGIFIGLGLVCAAITLGAASLLPNGDFEQADPQDRTKPLNWDKPDGLGVQWVEAPKGVDGKSYGKAIRIDTAPSEQAIMAQWKKVGITKWDIPKPAGNAIAETYGLSYYSDPIPVSKTQAYRISFDCKGKSGGAKVWVRGWDQFQGEKRRRWETIVNCYTKGGEWTHFSQAIFPGKARPDVTEMRVMLYGYYPAGVYWFDNVRIEPLTTAEYEAERGTSTPRPKGK